MTFSWIKSDPLMEDAYRAPHAVTKQKWLAAGTTTGRHHGRAVARVVVVVLDGRTVEVRDLLESTSAVVLVCDGVAHSCSLFVCVFVRFG
jgi:hypothetical protein